jgi:hypothetical protein
MIYCDRFMSTVLSVHDPCFPFGITYVVPVALALLESATSEAESAIPVA